MTGALVESKITEDYRCFKKGEIFTFDPEITLLVGDQGSGKSTLLSALHSMENWLTIKLSEQCLSEGCSTYFFDTEKMNPRMQQDLSGILNQNVYKQHIYSHFRSHGEVLKDWLINPLKNAKNQNAILFIDEPESGLSIRSQYQLLKEIKKQKKNKQFVIATHSIIFMEEIGKVLSLEHKKWMDTKDFLKTQKK